MSDHIGSCLQAGTVPPLPPSPQLEAAKKAYHLACKEEKLAMTREMNSKTEQSVTPEQQKKLQDKVDKCKQDVQKVPTGWGPRGGVGGGRELQAWLSPFLCPGACRCRRSMRRCWTTWARPHPSTWRAWSRCLNSASSLRKSGWSSSRRCCWTSNVTSTLPRIAGSWAWQRGGHRHPQQRGEMVCRASWAPCCWNRKGGQSRRGQEGRGAKYSGRLGASQHRLGTREMRLDGWICG